MCAPSPASGCTPLSQRCPCSLQNVIPLGEGEVDAPQDPETQLQEQEKRIEISCALAAEASRRGRMLSGKAWRVWGAHPLPASPAGEGLQVPDGQKELLQCGTSRFSERVMAAKKQGLCTQRASCIAVMQRRAAAKPGDACSCQGSSTEHCRMECLPSKAAYPTPKGRNPT